MYSILLISTETPVVVVVDDVPSHRVAACDLILEYTLSAAAVAKGFTAYFAALFAIPIHRLRFQVGWPTKESSWVFIENFSILFPRQTPCHRILSRTKF